jgi:hypothetical protein
MIVPEQRFRGVFCMKKRSMVFLAGTLALVLGGCGTPGGAVSDGAEIPIQAAQTAVEAQAAPLPNPYYTGEGGKGLSIAILAPQGKGLAANQDYLPALVQGEFVSNFSGYSAISVLDRVQLDNQYTELFSGYYDDNAEKGMDLGHLTPTDYIMGGSITKTATDYALQIQITKTEGKTTAASYSGTCTFAELDNLTGVRRAALDLLQKMGVEPTERAKTELAGAAAASHVNAQTSLAQGITAQKSGTVVEALSYYYQAESFDPALLEAANRAGTMSAGISSGNIGENVRNDIQRRKEWQKLLTEAEDYFSKHLPWEIVYYPTLAQGKVDYEKETVDLSFSLEVKPTDGFRIMETIKSGIIETGKAEEWGFAYWPVDIRRKWLPQSLDIKVALYNSRNVQTGTSSIQISLRLDLEKKGDILVPEGAGLPKGYEGRFVYTRRDGGSEGGRQIVVIRDYYEGVINTGRIVGGDFSGNVSFNNVNANDITDNMMVKIVSVNDIDAETIGKTGYIRISTGGMR